MARAGEAKQVLLCIGLYFQQYPPRLMLIAQVAISGNIITPGPSGKEGISLLVKDESPQCQELTPAMC